MTNQSEHNRIDELLLQAVGGGCSTEERDELNELLRAHPEHHTAVAESLVMDALIIEHLQTLELPDVFNALLVDDFDSTENRGSTNPWLVPKASSPILLWAAILSSAAALLVATSLYFFVLKHNQAYAPKQSVAVSTNDATSIKDVSKVKPDIAVGAITLSREATWDPSKDISDSVGLGDLHLLAGRGRIHLTNGVIVLADATKQPVEMCFNGDGSLDVSRGIVSADVSEEALGFSMRTPSTHVVDAGTRFSVDVDPNSDASSSVSRVTVLSGAVSCLPVEGRVKENLAMLVPGRTMEFQGPRDHKGIQVEELISITDDLDWMEPRQDSDDQELIAWESFNYPIGVFGKLPNGHGWTAPWYRSSSRNGTAVAVIRDGNYIASPAWLSTRDSKYFVVPAATGCGRDLSNPISLDEDRDIYVSFYFRKKRLVEKGIKRSATGITFRASKEKDSMVLVKKARHEIVSLLSIGHSDRLLCSTGIGRHQTGRALKSDRTYLMVIKLEIRKDDPDGIMACAFDGKDVPRVVPPKEWDCVGVPHHHTGWLRTVNLWSDPHAIAAFDELRIGNTWGSVVPLRH